MSMFEHDEEDGDKQPIVIVTIHEHCDDFNEMLVALARIESMYDFVHPPQLSAAPAYHSEGLDEDGDLKYKLIYDVTVSGKINPPTTQTRTAGTLMPPPPPTPEGQTQ